MTTPTGDAPAAPAVPVAEIAPAAPIAPIQLDTPIAPAPAPVVAEPAITDPADTTVTYAPTGDAGLDVALAFVGKLGIAMDDPAMLATANGDFSLIKAKLATLGAAAQGWEQMVALAEQANQRAAATTEQNNAAVANAVHETVGGAEAWATVSKWASANATPDEKAAINAMFDAGPVQARAAASMLNALYAKASGTVVTPAPAVRNAPASQAQGTAPLSRRDYSTAVDQLARKVGSANLQSSPEYAALVARRRAYS